MESRHATTKIGTKKGGNLKVKQLFTDNNMNRLVQSTKVIKTGGHNHYDLRNGKVLVIQPASKSTEDTKFSSKCPPLVLPKVKSMKYSGHGAQPLGKFGRLSKKYNRDMEEKYLHQLFCQKEKIGEGSFGVVYACQSFEDEETYAVKILQRGRKSAEIKHLDIVHGLPYCIKYHNAWLEGSLVYIQLELGVMSLAQYAEQNHNICEEECWDVLHDITSALSAIHTLGYCHMDVKPENVIITPDGKYKLCDFGLLYNLTSENKDISEGDAKYIATEILQGNITTAGDIFSLGITIMEIALDLVLPSNGQLWQDIRNCDWRTLPKGETRRVSIEMENTLNWMMSFKPEQRPSAAELLQLHMGRMKLSRSKKTRCNYFEEWYNGYKAEKESELSDSKVIISEYATTQIDSELDQSPDDNVRTPPRLISSVSIYRKQ